MRESGKEKAELIFYERNEKNLVEADLAAMAVMPVWAEERESPSLFVLIWVQAVGLFRSFLAEFGLSRGFWLAYRLAYLAGRAGGEPR